MKKTLLTACILLSAAFITGCKENNKITVPETVKNAFATDFPVAKKVKWSMEKTGEYEAEFVSDGTETSALFDTKGNLLETETEIEESQLPQAVKDSLTKNYSGYKTDEIEKVVNLENTVTYEMELKKDNTKYELTFDSLGNMLKKEEITGKGND